MSHPALSRKYEEDARLVILSELCRQSDGRLSDAVIALALEASGHARSRDWTVTQLRKMEEVGAVLLTSAGEAIIAQVTKAGEAHMLRRSRIEGIKQPDLGA